ncbi:type VII secretion-associated serine protease mycosin [Umezawaea endophytica]|uniref:Type VII secretion-associated serine protease mycosin n=1 Tax=Umezawaea endophytica TaxID=1654476 RepID=A0A9X2VJ37_9PSEU|nr:type VII secretion-associated serine protease mycosin [Umezawaea endophytica]MCS7477565.1 type VII secretion-associated serine protease mycosin [Umezawaea endophytica]
MPVARTAHRVAATAAAALLLITAPPALTTAVSAPTNAVPPPLDRSLLPADATPAADLTYARTTKPCKASAAEDRKLTAKPHAQLVLRLDEAHRFATGKGVQIAIIDTGVQPHQRLEGRVEAGGDYVVTADRGLVDCDGHGTEVAGVAAASRDQETGFVGAAPDATILSIRQTSAFYEATTPAPDGRTVPGAVTTLAQSIVHAVELGADVINVSLTSCGPPRTPGRGERSVQAAIDWAVNTKDVVVVAAAGNIGPDCTTQNDNLDDEDVKVVASPPWYRDDVLSVASVDRQGRPSKFTVWGPWVSIAAPGEEITTVDARGEGLTDKSIADDGKEGAIQGTSFAAPYVAGIAALVREQHPELTARQVVQRLTSTAQHPGNQDGRDRKVGAGVVDPVAALTSDLPRERSEAPPTELPPLATDLDAPARPDRTGLAVALAGSGVAAGLLLLVLFLVHTTRRVRARRG